MTSEECGEQTLFRDLMSVGESFKFAVRHWTSDGDGTLTATWLPNPVAGVYRKLSPVTYCNSARPDRVLSAAPEGGATSFRQDSTVIPVRTGNEDVHV